MMPSEIRHQNISIFADLDTLKKEERARRRLLRIQQVRQQSKVIASQVVAKTKQVREREEHLLKQKKELELKQWKHKKLSSLKEELNYGLDDIGSSYKAVEKEIKVLKERKAALEEKEKVTLGRGLVAAKVLLTKLEEDKLYDQERERLRKETRATEDLRAKSIASLPPISTTKVETVPSSGRSSKTKSSHSQSSSGSRKVELYNFNQPLPQQFTVIPDNIVQRVLPSTCQVGAKEEAIKELQVHVEKDKERKEKEALSSWLSGAAETRLTLKKEFERLVAKLPLLEQLEAQTRPDAPITLAELAKLEKKHKKKKAAVISKAKLSIATAKIMDPNDENDGPVPKQDLTAYPVAQFTPEEAGALGGTASSLLALLGSLTDESRRRLQEVVDDDFHFNDDDDFDYLSTTPPPSPPPQSPEQATAKVTVSHHITVCSPSEESTVTSEVQVTVPCKKKKKKKKSKSKLTDDQTVPKTPDEPVTKSVEIDQYGVAYIKKTAAPEPQASSSHLEHPEESKHKLSFHSNSTQYHSPPDRLLTDQSIDEYLRSIDKEKEQVKALLQTKPQSNVNLPHYIDKLLGMTRGSVEQLSVSDITESSSEVSTHKKKKKKRKKARSMTTSSTDAASSLSTQDSHVTLSAPSSANAPPSSCSLSSGSDLRTSSCEDSNLKFSESSSLKESGPDIGAAAAGNESTAYLSLQDISSRIKNKAVLIPNTVLIGQDNNDVDVYVDLSQISQQVDAPISRDVHRARLSTIIESDSSLLADDSQRKDSSESVLDIETELRKRGLPVLHEDTQLVSPNMERNLNEMKIKSKVTDTTPPSDGVRHDVMLGHSTPVSVGNDAASSNRFTYAIDQVGISPIPATEEKGNNNLSS